MPTLNFLIYFRVEVKKEENSTTVRTQYFLGLFKWPNWKTKKYGGLEHDFWINQDSNESKRRFHFIWSPFLNVSTSILKKELIDMKPKAVILGAGIWFLWSGRWNYGFYQETLEFILSEWLPICEKTDVKLILMLQAEILYPIFNFTQDHVAKLNSITLQVTSKFLASKALVLWDSHLALQRRYKVICNKYFPMEKADANWTWRCYDSIHEGDVVYDHYALMLLNYLLDGSEIKGKSLCQTKTHFTRANV